MYLELGKRKEKTPVLRGWTRAERQASRQLALRFYHARMLQLAEAMLPKEEEVVAQIARLYQATKNRRR